MQVVAVDSTTDPYDFGFTDFTFEVFSYNKFYIVARVLDESTGWVHTEAIKNYEKSISILFKEVENAKENNVNIKK